MFTARADKDYGVGEEVFISYGPKSNEGLWETYGFLLDENPYNCVEFSVNLDNGNKSFMLQCFLECACFAPDGDLQLKTRSTEPF